MGNCFLTYRTLDPKMPSQALHTEKPATKIAAPAAFAGAAAVCLLLFTIVFTVLCPFWLCWLLFEKSWPSTEPLNWKLQDWAGWAITAHLAGLMFQLWFHFIGKVLCCFLQPTNRDHHGCWKILDLVDWVFQILLLIFKWFLAVWGTMLLVDCTWKLASTWFLFSMTFILIGCYLAALWSLMLIIGFFTAKSAGGDGLHTVNEMTGKHRLIVPKKVVREHGNAKQSEANYVGDCDWC